MEFGTFLEFPPLGGAGEAAAFDRALDEVAAADRWGLDVATQVICGAPDSFAERLKEVEEQLGLDGILAELNCGGMIPHEGVMRALRLMCEEVKPRFH